MTDERPQHLNLHRSHSECTVGHQASPDGKLLVAVIRSAGSGFTRWTVASLERFPVLSLETQSAGVLTAPPFGSRSGACALLTTHMS